MKYVINKPTEEQKTCEHDKVFANFVFCSYPPQYPWICSKCGWQGTDRGELSSGPSYAELVCKFKEEEQ